jgi:hypothetical protein
MDQRMFTRAAGVSPPCHVLPTVCNSNPVMFGNHRTRTKSGGREPAVVCGIVPLSSEYPILFNEHRTGNRERRPSARRGVRDTIGEHPILFSAQQAENREWRALFNERTAMLAEITLAALLR